MLTTNDRTHQGSAARTVADELRQRAASLIERADRLDRIAEAGRRTVYVVPVDPADATICEGCE